MSSVSHLNGIYAVSYETLTEPFLYGAGAVVVKDGVISGSDINFGFEGSIQTTGDNKLEVNVSISRYSIPFGWPELNAMITNSWSLKAAVQSIQVHNSLNFLTLAGNDTTSGVEVRVYLKQLSTKD